MSIKKDDVRYVANLARINLTEEEEALFTRQIGDILRYIEKLKRLDTSNIEPMSHAVSVGNVFREDSIKDSLPEEEVLKNAPQIEDKFFKVPKIIE